MKQYLSILFFVLSFAITHQAFAHTFNPKDFGLEQAKTGVERYEVLMKCHTEAAKIGANVSYAGVGNIDLEIPAKAKTIPLTRNTDFSGCSITVTNTQKYACLFSMVSGVKPIAVLSNEIDNANFTSEEKLRNGTYLLVISDKNPWVDKRLGHNYGHTRKDIMLVRNGKGSNKPIMPYNNPYSNPECSYREVSEDEKVFANLRFVRSEKSTALATLVKVENENNVTFRNITVITPQKTGIKNDRLFQVNNCTNVVFSDIVVNGTYSSSSDYGYAFALNNVWNHTARNVEANGEWGVYGTNNLHKVLLENCRINRFDIHCYGRDVTACNCKFFNLYNQYGSVFGNIEYKKCLFANSIAFVTGGSYKAFVGVDVKFTDCIFDISKNKYSLVKIMRLKEKESSRKELMKKCLPNFTLYNCTFNIGEGVRQWYFFNLTNLKETLQFGYINNISMKNVTINGNAAFDIANVPFETEKPMVVNFKNVYKRNNGRKEKVHLKPVTAGKSVTVKCNRKLVAKKPL